MKINFKIFIGLLLTGIYLLVQLLIINDYGISWDFHFHHFGGLYHLGQKVPAIDEQSKIPFTPPDPRLTVDDPFGPFISILPTASYLVFYEKLHLLPFDSAYNLPSIIFGSLGVLVIFLFLYESINFPVAFFSAIFLSLLPTHFGYLHNNMKDVPIAFAFTLSIYLFWRLVKYRRFKDLLFAVLSFAFAFNVKINSVMIPLVCAVWFVLKERKWIISVIQYNVMPNLFRHPLKTLKQVQGDNKLSVQNDNRLVFLYFLLSPLAALLVWWPFWKDPVGKLLELPYYYSHNTLNMPVLFMAGIFRSGVNIPWNYPWIYIFITTPLLILLPFLIGVFIALSKFFSKNTIYSLLLLWFIIPLVRYFTPGVAAIDGMRHFMEIIYPLSALAGVGFYFIYLYLKKVTNNKFAGLALFAFLFIFLIYNIYKFHPYQTSFYNLLIGGIKGAEGKFDIDFWGAPQKQAMGWLNKNAPFDSFVYVVMAPSSASMYLRGDLLENVNKKGMEDSDYTILLNKRSFFTIYPVSGYLDKSLKDNKLVYSQKIDDVSLFWVIKN